MWDRATAGLPRHDAATTGLDGGFLTRAAPSSLVACKNLYSWRGRSATGIPSGPAGPTPTDSWPAAGAAASLAAGAATSLATASLVFMLCRSGPCVLSAPRSDFSRLSQHKTKGFIWCFAALYWGARGAHPRTGYECFRKKR